jgi:predicted HicB family RNase H-like nuclease
MPNLNVEVKEETMKAVRVQAAFEGVSQREWVERTLELAVNDEVKSLLQQEAR